MMPYTNGDGSVPRARPRPQKPKTPEATRDSGAVRASVLDAALQLGLGANPTVADWIFNNTLKEEDEDHISSNPGLTHSEESPASSPRSGRYPLTPSSPSSQGHSNNFNHSLTPNFSNLHFQNVNTVPFAVSPESNSLIPQYTDAAAAPPRPTTPSKLKKKRHPNKDGYESDAGMVSDAKRKKDKKKEKKDKDKNKDVGSSIPPVPALSVPLPSSSSSFLMIPDGGSETAVETGEARRRAKSLVKPSSKSKSAPSSPLDQMGYETDGGRKSKKRWGKKSSAEDDGDLKKSRSLFFRLGNKSSKGDLKKQKSMESTKEKQPAPPLPIAERFATTLNKETGAPMISLEGPSMVGGSRLGIDLNLGLSSDMFSTSQSAQPESRADSSLIPSPATATYPYPPKPSCPSPSLYSPQFQASTSRPPVSFPSSPMSTERPTSAGTTASAQTSTTNTHSHSTTAARTSLATSISTSQSHSQFTNGSGMSLKGVTSRESSSNDVPSLPPSSTFPQTPSKKRGLPFLGTPGKRSSISSGDGLDKEKEKEKKREDKERKRDKERLKEEAMGKKPMISLPLTHVKPDANPTAGASSFTAPEVVITPSYSTPASPPPSLVVPSTPHRPRPDTSPGDVSPGARSRSPTHPPVSRAQVPQQGGILRQISMSTLRIGRPASPLNGRASPVPAPGRSSPMPRGKGKGSPPSGRHSPLPGPPNALAYYDVPPPTPPPLSPLPSVPSPVSTGGTSGHLNVNVGIAVTTGSPLPSPLLVTSPHYNSGAFKAPSGVAKANGVNAPPTSFNSSSAAASALRAKVQRRLSQQDGFPAPTTNGEVNGSTSGASNIPIINAPSVSRGGSIRGRESPFPVLPFSTNLAQKGGLTANNNTAFPPRAKSPRSGWENDDEVNMNGHSNGEYEDDGMEDVRGVLARFRESRIDDGMRQEMEYREAAEGVIATRRSFEAFQGSGGPTLLSGSTNVPVSPSPSSGLNVPMSGDRLSAASGSGSATGSGKYDSFLIEEYYGHGHESSSGSTAPGLSVPPSRKPYQDDGDIYADDDDLEDASYYPDDEIRSDRRSRRRRSTLYLSDEEHDTSSNSGHGHGGKSGARSNRWSGSIYSRASFLDTEKSGEARQRFLRHVEEMLDERGERIPAVPPVPKLPEEFVAESRRAAAVARQEYEEFVMKRTIGVGARKVPAGSGLGR